MNRIGRAAMLLAACTLAAAAITKAFYAWPDLLPPTLRRLGNAIVDASGSTSIEISTDIEMAYLFGLSLLLVLALVLLARAARAVRRRGGRQP